MVIKLFTYNHIRLRTALGATIDFEAGNVKHAPKWVQKIAMEWFYRFLMEPRRMFKRYFVNQTKRKDVSYWQKLCGVVISDNMMSVERI